MLGAAAASMVLVLDMMDLWGLSNAGLTVVRGANECSLTSVSRQGWDHGIAHTPEQGSDHQRRRHRG